MRSLHSCALASLVAIAGCNGTPPPTMMMQTADVDVQMDFQRTSNFYSAPFPSDDLRNTDGSIDIANFPNPDNVDLIHQTLLLLARDNKGFGVSSGVYFTLTDDIDPTQLPTIAHSTDADAPVFLFDVTQKARHPAQIVFETDGGPFGALHLLSVLPMQGLPLAENSVYAAVVRRSVHDMNAKQLGVSSGMTELLAGTAPKGMSATALATYSSALSAVEAAGVPSTDIAGIAVYTTGSPTGTLAYMRTEVLKRPLPVPVPPFVAHEVFPDYCVYQAVINMPDYQQGNPPYSNWKTDGGGWTFNTDGTPTDPVIAPSNLYITVPRKPTPANGIPPAMFVRTGGGGNRPLVDRGTQLVDGGDPIVPGSGPAMYFAQAGYAGFEVDGPLGGLRNPQNLDEQFLIFNVTNAAALRDNVRESALELSLMANVLPTIDLDISTCPGASGKLVLDMSKLVLMGHSTGSEIATLTLATEPLFRLGLVDGAGGSWIENIMYKQKPEVVLPLANILLDYNMYGRDLIENDAALSLVQWAAESADDQVYARQVTLEPTAGAAPRHVLMQQGIVDNYIRPQIANCLSVPLGLDLGGAPLDSITPALSAAPPVLSVLPYAGRGQITLPASGNVTTPSGVKITAVLTQNREDGVEDGHEVVFQTDQPKHAYRCFLQSFLTGIPTVPAPGAAEDPCN